MSHALKYYFTHKANTAGNSTTYRFEILEDGFGGASTEITGVGFRHDYSFDNVKGPLDEPLQNSELEIFIDVQDASDLTILTDIVGADEKTYQLQKKVDGNIVWIGYCIPGRIEYSEGPYPFNAKIIAKDLTWLKGVDYPLTDNRETIITTIADLLDDLGYGLEIHTYTDWTEDNINSADDFLNQIYNDVFALREYAKTGDETDQQITQFEALKNILRNYGLFMLQSGGAWKIIQPSALSDPTSVREFVYNSSGVQQSSSSVDLTISVDRSNRFILPSTLRDFQFAIREVQSKFDHRTKISGIQVPDEVILDSGNTSDDFTQFITSDGNQRITLKADIEGDLATGDTNGRVQWQLKSAAQYWDNDNTTWTTSTTTNETDLTFVGPGAHAASSDLWVGSIDIVTDTIPSGADGTLTLTLMRALGDSNFANETRWQDTDIVIQNSVADENTTSIEYRLRQSGNRSFIKDIGKFLFGDGPIGYSRAALRHGTGDEDTTNDSWKLVGEVSSVNLFELLSREYLDFFRGTRNKLRADLWGAYQPHQIISYDSSYFLMIGGSQQGHDHTWNSRFIELNIQTGSDTFTTIKKYSDVDAGGTANTSTTGGSGSSGGLDQSTADSRYLNESNNLSDLASASTARSNLNLDDGSVTLDLSGVVLSEQSTPSTPSANTLHVFAKDEGGFTTLHVIEENDVELDVLRDTAHVVRNETGAVLTKGTPVYITGSNGNYPTVAKADASSATTAKVFGVVLADISDNAFGRVLEQGDLGGIDLSAYSEGDELFLSTTAGTLTTTAPTGNNKVVTVGTVIKNTAAGILEVETEDPIDFIQPSLNASFNGGTFNDTVTVDTTSGSAAAVYKADSSAGNDSLYQLLEGSSRKAQLQWDSNQSTVRLFDWVNSDDIFAFDTGTQEISFPNLIIAESGINVSGTGNKISFVGTAGGGGEGVLYLDSGGSTRYGLLFPGSDVVALANRASNGKVQIRANTATGGSGGEVTVATFEDDLISLAVDTDISGDLSITGGLIAEEFIIEQFRSIPVFNMTPAHGRVASVSGAAGSETVTLEDPRGNTANPFQADDIVIIKVLDTDKAILKEIYRKVSSISGLDVNLTDTGITWTAGTANDDTGSIEAGDFIISRGSTSSATRDHYIEFDVTSATLPEIAFWNNVDDVGAGSKDFRINKNGVTTVEGDSTSPAAYKIENSSGTLKGALWSNSGVTQLRHFGDNERVTISEQNTGGEVRLLADSDIMLDSLSGDILPTANVYAADNAFSSGEKTINDDTSTKIADFAAAPVGLIIVSENNEGTVLVHASTTGLTEITESSAGNYQVSSGAGAPTGTTGADGVTTIFLDTSNNDVYINNRSGTQGTYNYFYTLR